MKNVVALFARRSSPAAEVASPRINPQPIIDRALTRLRRDYHEHLRQIEVLECAIADAQAELNQHRRAKQALMDAMVSFQVQAIEVEYE